MRLWSGILRNPISNQKKILLTQMSKDVLQNGNGFDLQGVRKSILQVAFFCKAENNWLLLQQMQMGLL
jgi:hypothetical protein